MNSMKTHRVSISPQENRLLYNAAVAICTDTSNFPVYAGGYVSVRDGYIDMYIITVSNEDLAFLKLKFSTLKTISKEHANPRSQGFLHNISYL
jgi:hypothetical protein